jgi:ankyrin repeat protein
MFHRFRWAVCQLDVLRKCLRPSAIKQALQTLPKTLDETYDRILNGIPEEYHRDAHAILQLIAFSSYPLSLDEVSEAIAVNLDKQCFDPDDRLRDPYVVLEICSSLISVNFMTTKVPDILSLWTVNPQIPVKLYQASYWPRLSAPTGPILGFTHYSVKEYLLSPRIQKSPTAAFSISETNAHEFIAEVCVSYLLFFNKPDSLSFLNAGAKREFPFHSYVVHQCAKHFESSSMKADQKSQFTSIRRLFDSRRDCSFSNWQNALSRMFGFAGAVMPTLALPLCISSQLGYVDLTKWLLEEGADVDGIARDWHSDTALIAAASTGHENVVCLLLEKGADVNFATAGYYGTALIAAASMGHENVVCLLLEKGADVNFATAGYYGTALIAAASRGDEKVRRLLLENGANVNAIVENGHSGTALIAAASSGDERVVRLFLEKGADVNAIVKSGRSDTGTALIAAASRGDEKVARLFLENGANVNAIVKNGRSGTGTALIAAASRGDERVVQLFLENGANVNAKAETGGNALEAAIARGNKDVVRLLLNNGAATGKQSHMVASRQLHAPPNQATIWQLLVPEHKVTGTENTFYPD